MVKRLFSLFKKREWSLPSAVPSTANIKLDAHGQTLTEALTRARRGKLFLASDFAAKKHSSVIAMAASEGFLTSRNVDGSFGRQWFLTERGLKFLKGEIS